MKKPCNKIIIGNFFLAETSDRKTVWIGRMEDGLPDGESAAFSVEQIEAVIEKFYLENLCA